MRVALIGCGSMGSNHARLLMQNKDIDFVCIVEQNAARAPKYFDGEIAPHISYLQHMSVDAAIVAVPTSEHFAVSTQLCDYGIDFLVEKPYVSDVDQGIALIAKSESAGVIGFVGHIERFNPAMVFAKKKIEQGILGNIFQITTERVGPYPGRIEDVGVVKDLATHDIDCTRFLLGDEYDRVQAYTSSPMGNPHEDVLVAMGMSSSGILINHVVNWVSPTKNRSIKILGTKGSLVLDLLSSNVTFYENGMCENDWKLMTHFTGVAEGNIIKYAFKKYEPLQAEQSSFFDTIRGRSKNSVPLADALETLRVADRLVNTSLVVNEQSSYSQFAP